MTTQNGQHLAGLTRHYAGLRNRYLVWAEEQFAAPPDVALAHYRRALVAWYEASIRPVEPYVGEAAAFIRALAGHYFRATRPGPGSAPGALPFGNDVGLSTENNPLQYVPKAITLTPAGRQMLALFQQMQKGCRDVLLMAHYHKIERRRIAEVLELAGGAEAAYDRIRRCQLLAREQWEAAGITDPALQPGLADEELIEQYFTGHLETTERWAVEARLPSDPVFRKAIELREDWAAALTVAGRQDLMALLQREEAALHTRPTRTAPAAAPAEPIRPTEPSPREVVLSPRSTWWRELRLPSLMTVLAAGFLLGFVYLAYTTFGRPAPTRQAVENFRPYPNIFDRQPPRNEDERDLQRVLDNYYDAGEYLATYDELLPVVDAYPAAPLYMGVSALALDDPSRALDCFERIPAGSPYRPPAEWYEALAYLAMNRDQAAAENLRAIAEAPGHPFGERAAALLARMR